MIHEITLNFVVILYLFLISTFISLIVFYEGYNRHMIRDETDSFNFTEFSLHFQLNRMEMDLYINHQPLTFYP